MRRKSARNVSKASPEKPPEASTRKSRRHSKRRQRSSSRSSSADSDDVNLKTVMQEQATEVSETGAPTTPQVPAEEGTESENPVRTVTPCAAPRELRNLKILASSAPTSPASPDKAEQSSSRRRRNKSEDIASPKDNKPSRKSRRRGSPPANVEEQEEENEEIEEKRAKGKSKTKHKSKSEKTPKIQDGKPQIESEISENVQVTPQSPQATIDIRVDNESVSTIECETVANDETETCSVPQNTSDICDVVPDNNKSITEEVPKEHVEDDDACAPSLPVEHKPHNDTSKLQGDFKGFDVAQESTSDPKNQSEKLTNDDEATVETEVVPEIIEEKVVDQEQSPIQEMAVEQNVQNKDSPMCEVQEIKQDSSSKLEDENMEVSKETVQEESECEPEQHTSEKEAEIDIPESMETEEPHKTSSRRESKAESCSSSEDAEHAELKKETEESRSPVPNKDESNTKSLTPEDEDSISVDAIIIDNSSIPMKEDISFNLTRSFSPDVEEIVESNAQLQSMKEKMCEMFQTPPKAKRKRRWSNSFVGLELVKPYLNRIDIGTIKELCPELQFLEENEVKIDIREIKDRRQSSDQKERRTDRKVSIEYKVNDASHRQLETQSSVNSSEIEEVAEPEVDNSNIIAMNRKISIVDDTASKLKPPPSPAKNPVSEVLYITNLVRPFTLKQLKELLERTGKIKDNRFWTDRIKSKCYVHYETIEEAEATRNALHGVHWPIGNGKKLVIDYATPEDLETARNPAPVLPLPPPAPFKPERILEKENQILSKRQKPEENEKAINEREKQRSESHVREWDMGKEEAHGTQSRSRERDGRSERNDRRRQRRTPSPLDDFITRKQRKKEEDIPQKLMDDLFRKTKTTPSIYWLPLTPEEIATKQQQRLLRMAEHKRRMEESSRGRGDYGGRGAPYRRRYD